MKKILITGAIILSASLSFYAKQTGVANASQILKQENLKLADNSELNFKSQRMDIGQSDIK